MSTRTLTDELRSTLLFHALEAPEPNATVDRILNDTVGAEMVLGGTRQPAESAGGAVGAVQGGWRPSIQQVVAASVVALLLLAVAGINSLRARNTAEDSANRSVAGAALGGPAASQSPAGGSMVLPSTPGSAQDKAAAPPEASAKAAAPVNPTYAGKALDCATIRGSRLVTGQWDDYLSPTGELNYVFEFLCVGLNGERSASELQIFRLVNGQLRYQRTLLP